MPSRPLHTCIPIVKRSNMVLGGPGSPPHCFHPPTILERARNGGTATSSPPPHCPLYMNHIRENWSDLTFSFVIACKFNDGHVCGLVGQASNTFEGMMNLVTSIVYIVKLILLMFSYSINNTTKFYHLSYYWEDNTSIMRFFFVFPQHVILKRENNITIDCNHENNSIHCIKKYVTSTNKAKVRCNYCDFILDFNICKVLVLIFFSTTT